MKFFFTVTAILLLGSSCSKLRDHIEHHPEDIGKCCRVEMITTDLYNNSQQLQHFVISYNPQGNPVEVRAQDPMLYQYFDWHMRYDSKGRVSAFYVTDPEKDYAYFWHAYTYPSSKVIVDSFYSYAGYIELEHAPIKSSLVQTIRIGLDNKDRAVSYYAIFEDSTQEPYGRSVSYDHNGNLVIEGVTYDDKINPYQTNRTWQLIYGDFSRNNAIVPAAGAHNRSPTAYNSYGLPISFEAPDSPPSVVKDLFFIGYEHLGIDYSCDGNSGGVSK